MKRIFLVGILSVMTSLTFAFEGVIEQVYTDVNTLEQKTFVWYIDGENIKLDILVGEESMTVIPNFKALSIYVYGNKADENGDYWYTNSSLSEITVNAPQLRVLDNKESDYNGEEAKELQVMTTDGLMVVQFLERISMNMKNMNAIFAESKEFGAIFSANESGFPVSSMIVTESDAIYTLTTKSIEAKTLNASTFSVPSNYKLFTGIK